MSPGGVAGIVLAAGAGRRFGGPKALVPGWLADRVGALRGGGCDPVVVVLGAAAEDSRALVPDGVEVVVAEDWEQGMGASLRSGLAALAGPEVDAVVVVLVDTPGLTAAAVARVVAAAGRGTTPGGGLAQALAQATYDGVPGHPVLLGRRHWAGVAERAVGDRGARDYLAERVVTAVECGDVATGEDVDTR